MKFSLVKKLFCVFLLMLLTACATNPGTTTSQTLKDDPDRDGVARAVDRCPDTPAGIAVDSDGCPADSDGDGVFDALDRCPGTVVDEVVDIHGCNKDVDEDGIFDWRDRCAESPAGQNVGLDGCDPEVLTSAVSQGKEEPVSTLPRQRNLIIYFESDSADLLPEFHSLLNGLLSGLESTEIEKLEVVGHADSRGSDLYNDELSRLRAERVVAFMVASRPGLAEKVKLEGLGERAPVADNGSEMGRLLNRRVEVALDIQGVKRLVGR